jgi:hypothetical protein
MPMRTCKAPKQKRVTEPTNIAHRYIFSIFSVHVRGQENSCKML